MAVKNKGPWCSNCVALREDDRGRGGVAAAPALRVPVRAVTGEVPAVALRARRAEAHRKGASAGARSELRIGAADRHAEHGRARRGVDDLQRAGTGGAVDEADLDARDAR